MEWLKTRLVEVKKVVVANDCGASPTGVQSPQGQTFGGRKKRFVGAAL
jgi:hypothetical protein